MTFSRLFDIIKIHLYSKTYTLINFTASMYSHPCSSTNFYVIFQHFFIIPVKLFAYAGEQIMSNLGLLLKTVFCEDVKFLQNIKFLIHI